MQNKTEAHAFLEGYKELLQSRLPMAPDMEKFIRDTCTQAKPDYKRRHLRNPEAVFLNHFAVPVLHEAVLQTGKSESEATLAVLNEYHVSMKAISSTSPARTVKHPFTKVLGTPANKIYEGWVNPENGSALVQSCPDFALRHPFMHKVVFEGKYFSAGSLVHARNELVKNIYQAFFYRGLPFVPETPKARAAWDYDYSCLLAYDASPNGTLKAAWDELPKRVRDGFWDGANIYVMILGGEGRPRTMA